LRFTFVRWADEEKSHAIFRYDGIMVAIPRSRLIPHIACEVKYRGLGVGDVNEIAEKCAEESSIFGFPAFRHVLHMLGGKLKAGVSFDEIREKGLLDRYPNLAWRFMETCSFMKVRELIRMGVSTEEALVEAKCTRKV